MEFTEHWVFDKPRRYIAKGGLGLTFAGHFRPFPNKKRIRYFYYPRKHELLVCATDGLWWIFHKFHVERLSRTRFRLTPKPQSFIVKTLFGTP